MSTFLANVSADAPVADFNIVNEDDCGNLGIGFENTSAGGSDQIIPGNLVLTSMSLSESTLP